MNSNNTPTTMNANETTYKVTITNEDYTDTKHNTTLTGFEHFGVTFWQWQDDEDGEGDVKWHWENETEIWLFDEDWAYWDKL